MSDQAAKAVKLPNGASARKARADGQRNRERLVGAAREAFAVGSDRVSLESIARASGVGIGTLYRHFPTREALVEAVYESELDAVTAIDPGTRDQPADVALRSWMDRYALFVGTKRGLMDTLRAGWASGTIATPTTRARITAVLADLLASGVEQGVFRAEVEADDVTAALLGAFLSTASNESPEQLRRLLDLLIAGLALPPDRVGGRP